MVKQQVYTVFNVQMKLKIVHAFHINHNITKKLVICQKQKTIANQHKQQQTGKIGDMKLQDQKIQYSQPNNYNNQQN